jgi:hypothetical protein
MSLTFDQLVAYKNENKNLRRKWLYTLCPYPDIEPDCDYPDPDIEEKCLYYAINILERIENNPEIYLTCEGWVDLIWPNVMCVITDDEALIHTKVPFDTHDIILLDETCIDKCVNTLKMLI